MRWGMLSTMTASATPAAGRHTGDSVQRLMDAAVDAFADKGFHATSTRDIAARANMSPAGVYVHFASKPDLLFQLCQSGHVLALGIVSSARDSAHTPPAQLVAIVSSFARWHAEQFRTARIVQYEFPHLTPEHRDEVLAVRKTDRRRCQGRPAGGCCQRRLRRTGHGRDHPRPAVDDR